MGEENKVILHGVWASHYVKRVEIALKLKGIPFEFIEEDLSNKSPLLLNYNPVYKKVPVLVYNGKPVSESLIIVEYIDETWKNSPRFLPDDPFERAKVRFWADYIQKVIFQCMANIVNSKGEEQAEACEEFYEKLRVLEDGVHDLFPRGDPSPQGRNVGLLHIVNCDCSHSWCIQGSRTSFWCKVCESRKEPFNSLMSSF